MNKRSHKIVGHYLINRVRGFPASRYEKVFLFGCVEPDINFLTYFRGFRKTQPFGGHNYRNAEQCIVRSAERLQRKERWRMWEYYSLGKLIHYICDAFTYPHNEFFGESVTDHLRYEVRLYVYLQNNIAEFPGCLQECAGISAAKYILWAHHQYTCTSGSLITDIRYILNTTADVFNLLLPVEEEYLSGSWDNLPFESAYACELVHAGR